MMRDYCLKGTGWVGQSLKRREVTPLTQWAFSMKVWNVSKQIHHSNEMNEMVLVANPLPQFHFIFIFIFIFISLLMTFGYVILI